jgi:hypothetical protein
VDRFADSADARLACWERRSGWHEPDGVNYPLLLATYRIAERIGAGEIDECWLFGPPYSGFC